MWGCYPLNWKNSKLEIDLRLKTEDTDVKGA